MIGTIDVTVQAARPDLPLPPVRAFVGSPSSVRVRNVPRRIGEWDITRVFVTANYPDSTTETAECVLTGGVWVGTVRGCSTPGTSLSGFVVTADGVDEHGSTVSGYILGVGDVIVLTREESVTPGTITFKGDKGDKGDPGEVKSVNGKFGDVSLDANDVGAYSKGEVNATVARMDADIEKASAAADSASAAAAAALTKAENAQTAANAAQSAANAASDKADAANAALVDKLDKTAVVAPSVSATAGQAADAKAVNDALAMKAPSNITTASDDKIRIVYGDNVWWIVPLGIYYWNDGEAGEHAHSPTAEFALPTSVYSSSLALTSDIDEAVKDKADRASLAPEYSPSAAYPVGSIVYHDGNIYQCTTAIAEGGEAWTAAHWEMMKLDEFFTASNSLLTGTIDARLPYPLYAVPSTGLLKDRAINTTSLASATVPDNFTDLIVRASVASSLSVTMPGAIATKYGDAFPGEAGEYLITITKTGASEAYVRTIKLEVANA